MTEIFQQFPPVFDKKHFPLLTSGSGLPCTHLMGCEGLTFFALEDFNAITADILTTGLEWHLYGDVRWPSLSSWVEFDTSLGGFPGYSGVLVLNYEIPEDESDPLSWIAHNGPLQYLFPDERGAGVIGRRLEALRQKAVAPENIPGPNDLKPQFVQSYCVYREVGGVQCIARYTDLLNAEGIPIPRYRMANIHPNDIEICRFTLHSLFRINQARLTGVKFAALPQLESFQPLYLSPNQENPSWTRLHPSRILHTRPAVRAIPTPTNFVEGIMHADTAQEILESRRLEANLHMLAFDLDARPQYNYSNDGDICMGAFSHRANGGAIYVLPDRLVEEFDNTDCDEIRVKDITLPFRNLFLKFTPPQPLFLAPGAPVDGCYIAKQGEEYLLLLTSRLEDVDYSRSLSVTCLDPTFSLHLPAPELKLHQATANTDLCINEAVELGIKDFLAKNAPPTDDMSRTITREDGTTTYVQDVRAASRKRRIETFRSQEPVFRACLNIIINAACFISFRPEDITEEWDGNPPTWVVEALNDTRDTRSARDRRQHALRTISHGDYTRIRICGKNLFTDPPPNPNTIGRGLSPRAHWRRGHWRRQRHGTGLSMITPRWIRPTIVKKENGSPVEARLYEVPELPADLEGNG